MARRAAGPGAQARRAASVSVARCRTPAHRRGQVGARSCPSRRQPAPRRRRRSQEPRARAARCAAAQGPAARLHRGPEEAPHGPLPPRRLQLPQNAGTGRRAAARRASPRVRHRSAEPQSVAADRGAERPRPGRAGAPHSAATAARARLERALAPWRSLALQAADRLGIASLAVAYQDRLPHMEARGASRRLEPGRRPRADHPRISGHSGAVHRGSPPTTRAAGSSRPAPTAR